MWPTPTRLKGIQCNSRDRYFPIRNEQSPVRNASLYIVYDDLFDNTDAYRSGSLSHFSEIEFTVLSTKE